MVISCSCGSEQDKYTVDEQEVINYFLILDEAVKKDTTGTFSNIKYGTEANDAIVKIEKKYQTNKNDIIIKQIYLYAEVVSCLSMTSRSSSENDYYSQAILYAEQIDLTYNGPYAEEIISMAKKYAGNKDVSNTKSAITMSIAEKMAVKEFIYARYDYYDQLEGKYSGDKYTDQIWKETAEKFGLTTADIDLIWDGN